MRRRNNKKRPENRSLNLFINLFLIIVLIAVFKEYVVILVILYFLGKISKKGKLFRMFKKRRYKIDAYWDSTDQRWRDRGTCRVISRKTKPSFWNS